MSNHKLTDIYFKKMMTTSLISIVVCMMCLASLTWAWFSASTNSKSVLVSAGFEAEVSVADSVITNPESLMLAKGTHRVLVTQKDTAKTGYCLVIIDDVEYYAGEFKREETSQGVLSDLYTVNFSLNVVDPKIDGVDVPCYAKVSILPKWGIYNGDINNTIPEIIVGSYPISSQAGA